LSEESVLKVESVRGPTAGRPWVGLFLISVGIILLIGQTLHLGLARYLWPGFLAGFGLLLCLPAMRTTPENRRTFFFLSVPGAMILALSGLLFLFGLGSDYESLAYTWPLILAAGIVGLGYSKRHERQVIDDRSFQIIRKLVIITMVMAIVFELFFFSGLSAWWPLLLVAGGSYMLIKNRRGNIQ